MARYQVTSSKLATPAAVKALERAFARTGTLESGPFRGSEIQNCRGHLNVLVDFGLAGSTSMDGMAAFALAWYDAFGERIGGPHSYLIEETA